MLNIEIKTVPQEDQAYETIGNWFRDEHGWHIIVSDLGDWRYELLVAIHELVEMAACIIMGIPDEDVTNFDLQFEAARVRGEVTGEPGDAPLSPYRLQHRMAETVERLVAFPLGVDWFDYEQRIEDAGQNTGVIQSGVHHTIEEGPVL